MNPVYTINLTKEAFERLCEIREYICEYTEDWLPLNQICSALICQISIDGDSYEKIT